MIYYVEMIAIQFYKILYNNRDLSSDVSDTLATGVKLPKTFM